MFLRIITFIGLIFTLLMISAFAGIIGEKITDDEYYGPEEIAWFFSVIVASMFITALLF